MFIIDLQEGFSGDKVVLAVDGTEVFQEEKLQTRNQIGLARQIEVDVPSGRHTVSIRFGDAPTTREFAIDTAETPFLGITLAANDIVFTPKAQAFGYL